MKVTRYVWQYHDKKEEFEPVFDYFRYCANEGIRIGIEKNLTSQYSLHYQLYHKLRLNTQFHSRHVYGSLECAASKLKLYKKTLKKKPHAKKPYVSRNHLIISNMSYKIEQDTIRVPTESAKYIFIRLTKYVCEKIKGTKLGNVTITNDRIIISYSKEILEQKSVNFIGIDRNLNNITTCDSKKNYIVHDLSKANQIVTQYGIVKSRFRRNDSRIQKKIFQKYGKLQTDRVHNILHCTSKKITSQNSGIIMEDLKGIRKLYRKGNGQGKKYRSKMNSWSFYELQRQIEYKARWLGLPVTYVKAWGTSSKCAICGSKLVPEEHRKMYCSFCNTRIDRDANAACNILLRGTRVVPDGITGEAVMTEPGNKESVICRVDVLKSSVGSVQNLTVPNLNSRENNLD